MNGVELAATPSSQEVLAAPPPRVFPVTDSVRRRFWRRGCRSYELRRFAVIAAAAWAVAITPLEARQAWVVLKDCRLDADESNDADSFHIKVGRKEYIFRLYFVDAPETDSGFPDRVEEQGKYFGITPAQTLQLGALAKKFTKEKLAQPFTVRTCMQDALGRSKKQRFYAFLETNEGDLGELLVANGMARVHGTSANPDGLSSPQREKRKLQRLESAAKQQKVGAWGAPVGRMTARLAKQPAKSGPGSFDAFFHPERIAIAAASDPEVDLEAVSAIPTATPIVAAPAIAPKSTAVPLENAGAPTKAKLDPNTAKAEELMTIKGIGPILAGRIIEARPYKSADDLQKAKGIGPKLYERIRPYFTPSAGEPASEQPR